MNPIFLKPMDFLHWFVTAPANEDSPLHDNMLHLQTTQVCYRNTVRSIQELIQLKSNGILQNPSLKDTNLISNFKQLESVINFPNCLEYLLTHNSFDTLTTLCLSDCPSGLLNEFLIFLSNCINLLPTHHIISASIHRPLMRLLPIASNTINILYLIHALTNKIKSNPHLFHIFFYNHTCLLLNPLLIHLHSNQNVGDVSRHALVDLFSITTPSLLDPTTLESWLAYINKSNTTSILCNAIELQFNAATQLVMDLENELLPEDALINILLLVEQLMRMDIVLQLKLILLRGCCSAFIKATIHLQHMINNFSDVANEVRLRRGIDLLCKIATILTSKTHIRQYKGEYSLLSRIKGKREGDYSGDSVHVLDWTGSLGRLFAEVLGIGNRTMFISEMGDFKGGALHDILGLQTIQIPDHGLPMPFIVDLLRITETVTDEPQQQVTMDVEVVGLLQTLFEKINLLQTSPIFLRYKYLLMLLIKNHGDTFVMCCFNLKRYYKYEQYEQQRQKTWQLMGDIVEEMDDVEDILNEYMNELNGVEEKEMYRVEGDMGFEAHVMLGFVLDQLSAIQQGDYQNALVIFSMVGGLLKCDYKLADYLFNLVLPKCGELLNKVKKMDVKNPFKRLIIESTLEIIAIWRKRAFKYYKEGDQ